MKRDLQNFLVMWWEFYKDVFSAGYVEWNHESDVTLKKEPEQ